MIKFNINDSITLEDGLHLQILEEESDQYKVTINIFTIGYISRIDGAVFDANGLFYGRVFVPKMEEKKIQCDCGGFKTYGTYDKEFHSRWCEVNKYDH